MPRINQFLIVIEILNEIYFKYLEINVEKKSISTYNLDIISTLITLLR